MVNLAGRRVIVTGAGAKLLSFAFSDITSGEPTHTPIIAGGKEYKANIGAATAMRCAEAKADVVIVARSGEKLELIKGWIKDCLPSATVDSVCADLNDTNGLKQLVSSLPSDKPIDLVQSIGLGAGSYYLANDNPYLPIEELTPNLVEAELSVLQNTINLLQALLPIFRQQNETHICIVSSMSAIRSVVPGSIHMAAKAAISRFANAAMIELAPNRIFITDVRPGAVDTGLYDSEIVRNTVAGMALKYGYDYSRTGMFCAPPSAIGDAIVGALASRAHVTSINMVARGQWPHEGS